MPPTNPNLTPTAVSASGTVLNIVFDHSAVKHHNPGWHCMDSAGNIMRPLALGQTSDDQHWAAIFVNAIDTTQPLIVPANDPGLRSTQDVAPCNPPGYVVAGSYVIS